VPATFRRVAEQLRQVPVQLKTQLARLMDAAGARLRASVDLPTSTEVAELLARVEDLDRKLVALEAVKLEAAKPAKKKSGAKPANGAAKTKTKTKTSDKPAKKSSSAKARVSKIAERAKAKKR